MEKEVRRYIGLVPIILYLLVVFILAYMTDEALHLVLLGMMPSLLFMLLMMVFDPNEEQNHVLALASPVVLSFFVLLLWKIGLSDTMTKMEGPSVAFLNVVVCYLMLLFFIRRSPIVKIKEIHTEKDKNEIKLLRAKLAAVEAELGSTTKKARISEAEVAPLKLLVEEYQGKLNSDQAKLAELKEQLSRYDRELHLTKQELHGHVEPLRRTVAEYEAKIAADASELAKYKVLITRYSHELHMTRSMLTSSLRSIEDKCKAINFTIGRVYADKKGGSASIREKLHIPNEMYNNFSEMMSEGKDPKGLLNVLAAIMQRLEAMELPEHSVISPKKGRLPLERDAGDSVLDVLAKNDKDPVKDYHADAKMVCKKLMEYILNSN